MTLHQASHLHREIVLEQHLVDHLVTAQGYIARGPEDYDRSIAIDQQLVLKFVKEVQPDEWAKLEPVINYSALFSTVCRFTLSS
jgi:type I restriction enzyme, R subunit